MIRILGILAKNYVIALVDVTAATAVLVTAAHVVARATGWKKTV